MAEQFIYSSALAPYIRHLLDVKASAGISRCTTPFHQEWRHTLGGGLYTSGGPKIYLAAPRSRQFQKIIITKDHIKPHYNDDGLFILPLFEFLINWRSFEMWLFAR